MTISFRTGYTPGILGWMIQTQTQYYAALVNFGLPFECTVASGLAEFAPRASEPHPHTYRGQRASPGAMADGFTTDRPPFFFFRL